MDVERLIERLAVIADTSFLDHAAADDLREAASALAKLQADNKAWEVALNSERELWNTISDQLEASVAKLQAERDEAIDAQFTVDENCVSIGWEEVAAMWRSRATHAEARAEKAEAERDHNWKEYLDERSARMAENNRNHRLTEALQPFAVWADKMPDVVPELSADIMNVLRFAVANGHLTGAHFRAASRALGGGE